MIAVSVFIVTNNSAPQLRPCLDSLKAQSLSDFEIILVDNASRDETVAIIREEYPEVHLLTNPNNVGFGNANNLALTVARGRYVVLLNPETVIPSDTLLLAHRHMEKNLEVGMGGGLLQGPQGEWQPTTRQFPSLLNVGLTVSGLAYQFPKSRFFGRFDRTWANPLEECEVDWILCTFAILRRSLLTEIRLFDARFFMYFEEVDLCRRIYNAGFKVYYWPDLVITSNGSASSASPDDPAFSNTQEELTLWRIRSQLLYYNKWHGQYYCWMVKGLEQALHRMKAGCYARRAPHKAAKSRRIVQLWELAWEETEGGLISPPQPW